MDSFDGATAAPNADTLGNVENGRLDTIVFTIEEDMVFVGLERDFASDQDDDFYNTDGKGWISHITSESGEKVYFNVLGFELDLSEADRQHLESLELREDDILPDASIETADWFDISRFGDVDTSNGVQLTEDVPNLIEDLIPDQFQGHDSSVTATDFQFA